MIRVTASLLPLETLHQGHQPLLTSEFVLLEVAAAFAAPAFRSGIIAFINGLYRLMRY
ncbi:MAG: hypothetical protein HC837_17850 [Chloroflexaceae bacterium]|nr:hypothetical protein [Chloroflexaceae bacterium]